MSASFTSRKVEELNPYEVQEMREELGEDLLVLDVREPWEYYGDTGHVKDSLFIPMGEIPDKIEDLQKNANKSIAVICNSGNRSYSVCEYLMDMGFEKVYNIRGGIIQWHLSGLDVDYEEQ